jgi:hydrogenase expression/formation protein HypE
MNDNQFTLNCPIPVSEYPNILLAHGSGGKLMHQLIQKLIYPIFKNEFLEQQHDGAVISLGNIKIAFTTDSFVVKPIFFPGGNIGTLAVNGTVNDLAMCGAKPLYLSVALIIEEGLKIETLWEILKAMQQAAQKVDVKLVTGDTKVVDKGKGDQIFINTAGIGIIEHNQIISPKQVKVGDCIILNGDIGRHGIAIMAQREGLSFESQIESDCAPLSSTILALLKNNIEIHCLRDLTRGGLATALNEIALSSKTHIEINESKIPVNEAVKGACEILGFDPLYVACEGRFIAFVPENQAQKALNIINNHQEEKNAAIIGQVIDNREALVSIKSIIGATRIIDMLTTEQLPRIC